MQINPINNNSKHPCFYGATFNPQGRTGDLSEGLIKYLRERAGTVGNNGDTIEMLVEKKIIQKPRGLLFKLFHKPEETRRIALRGTFGNGGVWLDKDISYIREKAGFDEEEYIKREFNNYLSTIG